MDPTPAVSPSALHLRPAAALPPAPAAFRRPLLRGRSFAFSGNLRLLTPPFASPRIASASRCADPRRSPESLPDIALLVEVEGVLADIYRFGNRQAFNVAFQNLGLDCAHWTEPVYVDLTRKAGGNEERMLLLFFNRIGWPTSLPTNEKETFIKKVMREKCIALNDFVQTGSLPLRPGVENFLDDALGASIPVVMVTAYSKIGDKMSRFVIDKLGSSRTSMMKIVGKEEVQQSLYGQLAFGKGVSSSLDDQLSKEIRKAVSAEKQRVAEKVASILKVSVDIDSSSSESIDQIVATLRAGAEYTGLPVQNCILISGSQSGVLGAERIGMPSVVIRSSLTSRAEFHAASAVMDGFGGADLTVNKLQQKKLS